MTLFIHGFIIFLILTIAYAYTFYKIYANEVGDRVSEIYQKAKADIYTNNPLCNKTEE